MKTSTTSFAALGLTAALLSGCAHVQAGTPVAATASTATEATSEDGCTAVGSPLTDIAASHPDEPLLRIPQPAGWRVSTKMNSEIVRFVAGNPELESRGFTPNVLATLETFPAGTSARTAFAQERLALVAQGFGTDIRATETAVCGTPAERVEYTLAAVGGVPPHPVTLLMTYMQVGGTPYVATVSIQSLDPDNPDFRRDAAEIIDGFQMLPPLAPLG